MSDLTKRLKGLEAPAPDLHKFGEQAFQDRVAQVAFGWVSTPVGTLLAVVTHNGLLRLAFESDNHDHVLEKVAHKVSPTMVESASAVDFVRLGLEEYFAGRGFRSAIRLDRSLLTPFQERVLDVAYNIRPGEVRTYGQVAELAGNAKASRAAGRALGANPIPVVLPCHRVVASDGSLHGYAGGLACKQWLLEHERSGAGLPR